MACEGEVGKPVAVGIRDGRAVPVGLTDGMIITDVGFTLGLSEGAGVIT